MDYKTSGVDVEAGRAFVDRIKTSVQSTHREEVIGGLGGFGGFMKLPKGIKSPVLVSGTDGVGTKLELAQDYKSHFGVGIDLVAMCVNDVITSGAKPLFFLDYIATGALMPNEMAEVIEGISTGCKESGCALLGGETAEMPGFYPSNRYDLAGFCVGVVEESKIIDGKKNIKNGDVIIGVESSGLHSNGFSLVRKILEIRNIDVQESFGQKNQTLIECLLEPTYLYSKLVQYLIQMEIDLHGLAHITGGGLPENLPRCVPAGLRARINISNWERPLLFEWLKEMGNIPENDLWNTFNLGIGFCLIVPLDAVEQSIDGCHQSGFKAWTIGSIEAQPSSEKNLIVGLP